MITIKYPLPYKYFIVFNVIFLISLGNICFAQTPAQKKILEKLNKIKNSDTIVPYTQKLIDQARQKNDKAFEAMLLLRQSFYVYTKGDERKSLEYARLADSLAAPNDSNTYTQSRALIAYMLSRVGNNVDALKIAFEALRKTDDKGWRKLSIGCNMCIADIYRSIHQSLKALPYAQQAATVALEIKDTSQYISALSNLSLVYSTPPLMSPVNIAKATAYMETILNPSYMKFLSVFTQARYLNNTGRLYELQKKYDKAEFVLLKSLDLSEKGKFLEIEKGAINGLMTVKMDEGKYAEAIEYGKKEIAILPDSKSTPALQRDMYYRLADVYVAIKDYGDAYKYQQRANKLNDSLMSVNSAAAAAELDDKYKADKRLLLEATNTRLARQQRNFTIIITIIIIIFLIGIYRWLVYKRKKEAELLAKEHRQLANLDAMKTRFFNNISHELRTPLTLIIGPMDELINNHGIEKMVRANYLQMIWRNSKKLLGMVNELLDLGKIEAGNIPVNLQSTGLYPFITMIYQAFVSFAEYKKINYTLKCSISKDIYAKLDREKFEKVINNLISNAIKFTPTTGSVTVDATLRNGQIVISVTDTGRGIKEADLPRIFDRYYQGYRDEMPMEGGTGIGLAIAKEFTSLLNGTITAESVFGSGAVFTVSIPFLAGEVTDHLLPVADEAITFINEQENNTGQLIMLVEDHAEMADYIKSVLALKYQVIISRDGADAYEKLQSMTILPDLIISDVMMPVMDGFALLGLLKKHPVFCRLPVIMLTALADSRNKLRALNIGVDDYLTKPFISNELLARVVNLLNNAIERRKAIVIDEEEIKDEIGESVSDNDEIVHPTSPADLVWLASLETLVRKYTGKFDLNIAMLSDDMAISERQLFRRIKVITGLTPNRYIRAIRLQVAREAIESGKYRTISEISYAAGFDTPAYFSKLFKEYYGRDVSDLL